MKKTILPRLFWAGFLLLLLLASCKSSQPVVTVSANEALRQFMDTVPGGGKLVFVGVAGIRSKMEDSINLALEEAARRVAIFHEVEGEFYAWSNSSARLFDYVADSGSSLRYDTGYKNYVEALEFDEETDVFRSEKENAVFVRVRYPGSLGLNYRPALPLPGEKPYWIENPPAKIGEYSVGVGYSSRRDPYRGTVTASYENAVFSIIRNLYSVTWNENFDSRGSGVFNGSYSNRQGLEAKGVLSGFYVLETWIDPADRSVWTLAVAKSTTPPKGTGY